MPGESKRRGGDLANESVNKRCVHAAAFKKAAETGILRINDASLSKQNLDEIISMLREGTLTTLDLKGTDIGSAGIQEIANALKTNNTLLSLNLSKIDHAPNGIQAIAEMLKENSTLTELELSELKLSLEEVTVLAEGCSVNTTVSDMNFSHTDFGGPTGKSTLLKTLGQKNILESLNLSFTGLGSQEAPLIAKIISSNTALSSLMLLGNTFGAEGLKHIFSALYENRMLTTLEGEEFSNDAGGLQQCLTWHREGVNDTIESFQKAYATGILKLVGGTLNNPDFTREIISLLQNNQLKSLTLNHLKSQELKVIIASLKTNTTLESLTFAYCMLDFENAQALAKFLRVNKSLTSLELAQCHLSRDTLEPIIDALQNTKIQSLNLLYNELLDCGKKIAEMLVQNSTLTTLDLSTFNANAGIGLNGLLSITKALKQNSTLTTLALDNILPGTYHGLLPEQEKGISAMLEALQENYTLTEIDGGTFEDSPEIQSLLKRNREELGKRDQRIAFKQVLSQFAPDVEQSLFNEITAFSSIESAKQKVKTTRQEQEEKQQQERDLLPLTRILAFVDRLSTELISNIQAGQMTASQKQMMIKSIDDTIDNILEDARARGQSITHIPVPALGRDATQGDDTEKIRKAINQFEENLTKTHANTAELREMISEIAEKLRRKWNQVIDERHINNPVERIIVLIDRLNTQIRDYGKHPTKEQHENLMLEIQERMESIREFNKKIRYCFNEEDAKKISKQIEDFSTAFSLSQLVDCLKEQYALTYSASSEYAEGRTEQVRVHLPPKH